MAIKSRPQRWHDACQRAEAALQDLEDLREEYESWKDSLPENLQTSQLGEKLDTICDLGIQSALDLVQECSDTELPLGFGRD